MMLANIQDLMLDGTKKLNIEEAFFIALGMYTYTNKKGNKIPINKDDLVKIENGECSRKGRLEQASERYRMGEEMYKNP